MRHDIQIEGFGYRLRPASIEDSEFIVSLRADKLLGRYLGDSAESVESQRQWMATYLNRPDDYYFVVERNRDGVREGTVGIYEIQKGMPRSAAEWGRWLLRKGSLAATESCRLIYTVGFDILGLTEVFCRTVAANSAVISFHQGCGLGEGKLLLHHFMLRGEAMDAIEHRVARSDWPILDRLLTEKSEKIMRVLQRAEK